MNQRNGAACLVQEPSSLAGSSGRGGAPLAAPRGPGGRRRGAACRVQRPYGQCRPALL